MTDKRLEIGILLGCLVGAMAGIGVFSDKMHRRKDKLSEDWRRQKEKDEQQSRSP